MSVDRPEEEQGGISEIVGNFIAKQDTSQVQNSFTEAGEKMDQGERTSVIQMIMSQLGSKGFDTGNVTSQLGLSSSNAQDMGPTDLGKIAGFVKEKAPFIFPLLAEKMPQLARYLGVDTSGMLGGMGRKLLGGD